MRVTMHSGKGRARHNDRTFDIDRAEHIDQTRTSNNLYWCWSDDERFALTDNFADAELQWYRERYQASLDAKNARYLKQRHPERCKTIEDMYTDRLTEPHETIWQIGDKSDKVDPDLLLTCYQELLSERQRLTGNHLQVLDWALHVDEQGSAHIHERTVWEYLDKDGHLTIGQNRALKELGVELPHPDKPESKTNHRKMAFDGQMRALWQDICIRHGLQIETVPLPGRRHLDVDEYIYEQQRQRIRELERQVKQQEQSLQLAKDTYKNVSKSVQEAFEQVNEYQSTSKELQAVLGRLDAAIDQAKDKLSILDSAGDQAPDPGKRSILRRDTIKLSKTDYDDLRSQASVGLAIDAKSQELRQRSIDLTRQEQAVAKAKDSAYREGRSEGLRSLGQQEDELRQERQALRQREQSFAQERHDAYIGRQAQRQGLISKEDLAILETDWLQSQERRWLQQLQEREHRSLHQGRGDR